MITNAVQVLVINSCLNLNAYHCVKAQLAQADEAANKHKPEVLFKPATEKDVLRENMSLV